MRWLEQAHALPEGGNHTGRLRAQLSWQSTQGLGLGTAVTWNGPLEWEPTPPPQEKK